MKCENCKWEIESGKEYVISKFWYDNHFVYHYFHDTDCMDCYNEANEDETLCGFSYQIAE